MGQLSDPYEQAEDEGLGITISGLPGELDEPEPDADAVPGREPEADDATDTEVVYDLDDWSEIERGAVTDRLREAGIPHGWEATSLHVAEADEAAVENILDIVEGENQAEADLTLDAAQDQVAYDLSDWDDDRLAALVDELDAAGIVHGWDQDELFVYAADEQAIDELLDRVAHPHELPPEADDGPAGAELLGEVFVAADRLQHDPDDHEGTVSMLDLGHAVEGAEPPFGIGTKEWDHLQGRVGALCSQLRASKVDEDAVIDAARDLRNALRSYV